MAFIHMFGKEQTLYVKSQNSKSETMLRISPSVFPLSWSHNIILMGIE